MYKRIERDRGLKPVSNQRFLRRSLSFKDNTNFFVSFLDMRMKFNKMKWNVSLPVCFQCCALLAIGPYFFRICVFWVFTSVLIAYVLNGKIKSFETFSLQNPIKKEASQLVSKIMRFDLLDFLWVYICTYVKLMNALQSIC